MLLRSGRATFLTIRPRRHGPSCASVEAARRLVGLLPRKGSPARRQKSRSPPASPEKEPVTPPSPEVPVGAPLLPAQYSSPGEDGSSRASVEAESPSRVIKRSVDDEPSPTRRVKSRPPPESPHKQLVAFPPPEAGAGVTLDPPEVGTLAQHGGAGEDGTDDESIAKLGIKLFPCLPRDQAATLWVGFVNDAKTCIKQYNIKHKVNFMYKHEPSNGFYRVEEQDDRVYYHMNFMLRMSMDTHSSSLGRSKNVLGLRCRMSPAVVPSRLLILTSKSRCWRWRACVFSPVVLSERPASMSCRSIT